MAKKAAPSKAPTTAPAGDRLATYRAKRTAAHTPEPFGGTGVQRPGLFVVQKHKASRMHHDLRLEMNGVLRSWAVPLGLSLDPSVKRFAAETEDHPIEYADFEGIIPAGNYGAGAMIVWDRGSWREVDDPKPPPPGTNKILFELSGYKLRGVWTLVETKKKKEWLLMKKPDGSANDDPNHEFPQESILSGLTVEELESGTRPGDALVAELAASEVAEADLDVTDVKVMLAETSDKPFSRPGWLFELKYDGYRLLAAKRDGRTRLLYRSGRDATHTFPEIARAVSALPYDSFILDGEVVVLDDQARPVFQHLQRRGQLQRALDIERAAVEYPVTYYAFDLLTFEGFDLRPQQLTERKSTLRRILPVAGPIRYSDHIDERGLELFQQIAPLGLEGVMAKDATAPYAAGRSKRWLKVKVERVDDFIVVGWTAPKGSRQGFGALHLAVKGDGELIYAGRVGSGFTPEQIEALHAALAPDEVDAPTCGGPIPTTRGNHWVTPRLVAEIRYHMWTEDGVLRFPVFQRLRDDKSVDECTAGPSHGVEPSPTPSPPPDAKSGLTLSRLGKVFWPDEGYTKGDLIEFYRAAAPWLLPYLRDRPVLLVRYPDGVGGKSFYQKKPPDYVPDWIRTASIWSEADAELVSNFLVDDVDSLLYLINLGTIPIHIWSSRLATLAQPDWSIIDFDPKGAPFTDVVTLARATHDLCTDIGLPCYVKTSGSTGLHVLFPLGRACTYEQSRQLAELVSRVVAAEHADIATMERMVGSRDGKVYLDYLQNGHGKVLVAPYSVRPLPAAPVATPLRWDEVTPDLDLRSLTIATVPDKLARWTHDPMVAVIDEAPDLGAILGRLATRFASLSS